MRICVDLDGTISASPARWSLLMVALRQSDHWVGVLTGHIPHGGTPQSVEERRDQLDALGVSRVAYDAIVLATGGTVDDVARAKAQYLASTDVDFFFDDTPLYVTHATRGSPSTVSGLISSS